jgi:predicted aconitase
LVRLQQIRDLAETLDLMFGAFLAVRVGNPHSSVSQWEAVAADMRAWLKGGARRAAA